MNVLSCFDGMSCGQIALERAGIRVDKYFASEIDKYAIQVTQKNYPDTIQLGDINEWKSWKLPKIDLLIGGSPCQGFSFAGRGLNFEDPRSKLFFVFVDVFKHLRKKNPKLLFLFENVKMKKEHQDIISKMLNTEPIFINSSLVSAQSRPRLYWTNIAGVEIPEDRNIYLRDVLQNDGEIDEGYYVYSSSHAGTLKFPNQKAGALTGGAHSGGNHSDMTLIRFPSDINDVQDRNLHQVGSIYRNNADAGRIYSSQGLARTLKGESGGLGGKMGLYNVGDKVRRLTPIECERLQTVPEGYTDGVSNTQRYKMLGNGWTVDVIAHIFSYIKNAQNC